jgi:hypothetical protein
MANGWKPKKNSKKNVNNVFSLNYIDYSVDEMVKELLRNKKKYKYSVVYLGIEMFILGPRKSNSYDLH